MKTPLLALLTGLLHTACATTSEPLVIDTPMRVGMTREELRAKFGPPLRVERDAEGGESWYYNFGAESKSPTTYTETTQTPYEKTVSYGVSFGKSLSYAEATVKLSPLGKVEAVPPGKVVLP
jgi:outer membrane protein assembly factor BamE (lipoprotein component of BamABCDE complex)